MSAHEVNRNIIAPLEKLRKQELDTAFEEHDVRSMISFKFSYTHVVENRRKDVYINHLLISTD